MTMRMVMSSDSLAKPVTITGSGYQNFRRRTARLTLDMGQLAEQSNGQMPADATMDEIFVYPAIYMRSPIFNGPVPGGKWAKMDLRANGRKLGFNFDTFMQSDPTQSLRYLRVAGEDVKREGEEAVRGIPTTHYTATMNLHKAPDFFPEGPQRDEARKSMERVIELSGLERYPVAVWIDRRNMVRRMSMSMDMKVQGQQMKMDMSFELFDFGAKPAVKPPPAKDVVELPGSGAQAGP
jgi:hypothetical protein